MVSFQVCMGMESEKQTSQPFWMLKTLDEMSSSEWESLCDGCARCCLYKLQDEDTGEIFFTRVVCKYLDLETCRCTDYEHRNEIMPTCIELNPRLARELTWIPSTCAYARLARGEKLSWWHPLVSQNRSSVHIAGISVKDRCISEDLVDLETELEDYVVDWIK